MKYAIISDIHANLEALESVLSEVDKRGIDVLLCLGDVVGYGPNPNECIDLVRSHSEVVLAGNHDYAPLGKLDLSYFNTWAREAVEWTDAQLTEPSREFLDSLPLTHLFNGCTLVHATPFEPERWHYIITIGEAVKNFAQFDNQICFVGHSHVPMVVAAGPDGDYNVLRQASLTIEPHRRYIINVGSVGQPRDSIPRCAFGIYDTQERSYELIRIDYDIAETQSKILKHGLPAFLAERLEFGQ